MPELALRCAQFFHSVSKYCLGYYRNCNHKMIKIKEMRRGERLSKLKKMKGIRNRKSKKVKMEGESWIVMNRRMESSYRFPKSH